MPSLDSFDPDGLDAIIKGIADSHISKQASRSPMDSKPQNTGGSQFVPGEFLSQPWAVSLAFNRELSLPGKRHKHHPDLAYKASVRKSAHVHRKSRIGQVPRESDSPSAIKLAPKPVVFTKKINNIESPHVATTKPPKTTNPVEITTTTTTTTTTKAYLLRIPSEIRNQIYDLLYDPSSSTLCQTKPTPGRGWDRGYTSHPNSPPESPILASSQLRSEMNLMYAKVHRDYWLRHTFVIDFNDFMFDLRETLQRVRPKDLAHIQRFAVFLPVKQLFEAESFRNCHVVKIEHTPQGWRVEEWRATRDMVVEERDGRVKAKMARLASRRGDLDPHVGHGLTLEDVEYLLTSSVGECDVPGQGGAVAEEHPVEAAWRERAVALKTADSGS